MIFIYVLMVIIIVVCALAFILTVLQAKRSNLITEGIIVSIRRKIKVYSNGKSSIYYFPTFKFNVDGKEYIKESASASDKDIYKEGQQIKVAYYQENPMDAIILADKKNKIVLGSGLTILTIIAGIFVLSASLFGNIYYILPIVGVIVLIICYFICDK